MRLIDIEVPVPPRELPCEVRPRLGARRLQHVAIDVSIEPIGVGQHVIDTAIPLLTGPWGAERVHAVAGDGHVAWHVPNRRADRRGRRRQRGAVDTAQRAGGPEIPVRDDGGREAPHQVCRLVGRKALRNQVGERRHLDGDRRSRCFGRPQHIERSKEERAILDNRPAQTAGFLVALEPRHSPLKDVRCLQGIARMPVRETSVKPVGALLGERIDAGAGVVPLFGGEVVDGDAHFLDGLGVRLKIYHAVAHHRRRRPGVDREPVLLAAIARRVERHIRVRVEHVVAGLRRGRAQTGGSPGDARRERKQVEKVSPDDRQIRHVLRGDHAGDAGFGQLDRCRRGRDVDGCRFRADLERDVHGSPFADLQAQLGERDRLEAGGRHRQVESRSRERGEPISTRRQRSRSPN